MDTNSMTTEVWLKENKHLSIKAISLEKECITMRQKIESLSNASGRKKQREQPRLVRSSNTSYIGKVLLSVEQLAKKIQRLRNHCSSSLALLENKNKISETRNRHKLTVHVETYEREYDLLIESLQSDYSYLETQRLALEAAIRNATVIVDME